MLRLSKIGFTVLILLFALSCQTKRSLQSVIYFNNVGDSLLYAKAIPFEPVIQKADRLAITVTGLDPASAAQFNQTPLAVPGTLTSSPGGYIS